MINSTLSSDANLQNDWHPYGFLAHLLERRPENAEVMSLTPEEAWFFPFFLAALIFTIAT